LEAQNANSAEALSAAQEREALLALAQQELAEEQALTAENQRELALLNQQTATLRQELNQLQGLLDSAAEKDAASQVQIEALGRNLNVALARAAAEERRRADLEEAERKRLEEEAQDLQAYRSEFFGRVREIIAGREGIQVVGDRFVFSSEVLFDRGSATLGSGGQAQLAQVASVIREIAPEIPDEINWVLRVDGHTDTVPITSGRFADNWELSQARALSVVRYLISNEGLPADRLAANGFGEFQPIDTGTTPEALARNRRIELKFTER
ncbi:MAG: peptidoglycan -binding protein, partial [Pseudomonadota bacterium]